MITFLYPDILWFLWLALIPIILHLINLHRHKVLYFSRLSFLKKVDQRSRRTRKIHNFWILLLRTLTIVFLVLTFASPRFRHNQDELTRQADGYVLFLDNSLSMQAENKDGSLLMQGKNYINQQFSSLSNDVSFQIITHQGIVARNIFPGALQQVVQPIDYSATVIPPEQLVQFLQRQLGENSKGRGSVKLLILSDFQKNYWSRFFEVVDSLPAQLVVFSNRNYDNISIDTLWFENPYRLINVEQGLWVKLTNHGENYRQSIPVRLYLNDSLKSVISVDLESGESKNLYFSFELHYEGWYRGKLEIDDNSIVFDDSYFFSFQVKNRRKVILVGDEKYYQSPKRLFDVARHIDYRIISHNDLSVDHFDSVAAFFVTQPERVAQGVFDEMLQRVSSGALLAMFLENPFDRVSESRILNKVKLPSLDIIKEQKSRIKILSLQHLLFRRAIGNIDKDAKLPNIARFRSFSQRIPQSDIILVTETSEPVLIERRLNEGSVYIFTSDVLQNDDFTTNPLFVPIFINMVQFSGKVIEPIFTLNDNLCFELPVYNTSQNLIPQIIDNQQRSIIPRFQTRYQNLILCLENQIQKSGIYSLVYGENAPILLSINYSRSESDYLPLEIEQLQAKGFDIHNAQQRIADEKSLSRFPMWQIVLLLGLACFVAEIWILTSEKTK